MIPEFISQYEHTWEMFSRLVVRFDDDAWLQAGRGAHTPTHLSWHILNGVQFDWDPGTTSDDTPPSQNEVLSYIAELRTTTTNWLSEMDYEAENETFPWTGKTRFSVALFLLRHTVYPIGELSMLLNESCDGVAEDSWIAAMEQA